MTLKKVLCANLFVDYRRLVNEINSTVCLGPAFSPQELPLQSPFPDAFKAVWDTGATGTSISEAIALRLQLRHSGQTNIRGVTGVSTCNTYLLALHLPNGAIIPEIEAAGCVENIGCDILIGMDVINMGDFAICNLGGRTTFSFRIPSIETIDFTQEREIESLRGQIQDLKAENAELKTRISIPGGQ